MDAGWELGRTAAWAARVEGSGPSAPSSRLSWAELLRRVFREDVLECNRCAGRRVVLAFLIERSAVEAILEHLGLPTTGPPVAPARGSRQMELAPCQTSQTTPPSAHKRRDPPAAGGAMP